MSQVDDGLLEYITRAISLLPGKADSFEPASTVTHSAAIYAHHVLCIVFVWIDGWRCTVPSETIRALFRRSKFRSFVACANAFANTCIAFGNLLMVDGSYISLAIILIIFLVFIGAFFLVVVSPNSMVDGRKKGGFGELEEEEIETKGHRVMKGYTKKNLGGKKLRREEKNRGGVGEAEVEEIETKGHTGRKGYTDKDLGTKTLSREEKQRGEVGEEEEEIQWKPSGVEDHTGRKKLRREEKQRGEVAEEEFEEEIEWKSSDDEDHTGRKKPRREEKERGEDEEFEWESSDGEESRFARRLEEEHRETLCVLLWMVRLPCMLLCLMRYFSDTEMEITICLLFITCSLGELTAMMSRLLVSEKIHVVEPAFEVVYEAFLVMGLLTAHTMAAELLGEAVLLVCMPELVAALVWLTIYLGSDDTASAVRNIKEVVGRASNPLVYLSVLGVLASLMVIRVAVTDTDTNEAEGAMFDLLLSIMSSAIVVVLFSLILPSLCMCVLWMWPKKTTSEVEGAIKLLKLFQYGSWTAAVLTIILAKQLVLLAHKTYVHLPV